MHAANHKPDAARAGFTIVEALVALAVMAISLVAIGAVMASTARGTRQLENHVALVEAANDVLWLDLPGRNEAVAPVVSGRTMDHDWRAVVTPLTGFDAAATADARWQPLKLSIDVRSPSGAVVSVETVRLFRRPSQ